MKDVQWVDKCLEIGYVQCNGIKNNKVVYQIVCGVNSNINLINLIYDINGVFKTVHTIHTLSYKKASKIIETIQEMKSFCKSLERKKKIANITNNN